jgi:DNA-binding beta-propeller fold protein YncE
MSSSPANIAVGTRTRRAHAATSFRVVVTGYQASGLAFNPAGTLALVTNRADKSISVLSVKGTEAKLIDTVDMGDIVSAVAFTPDGKRVLATKFNAHKVALLDVDGDKVTYSKASRLAAGVSRLLRLKVVGHSTIS